MTQAASNLWIGLMQLGTAANRPATPNVVSTNTAFYYATDTNELTLWTGSAWVDIGTVSTTPTVASGTYANRPTAPVAGAEYMFTDATVATQGATISAGSGSAVALGVWDGTRWVTAAVTQAATGTGSSVNATSPTLVTPVLGVAAATSVNGLIITTTTATLTLAGNLITTGAFNTTFAQAASVTITLPATSATMARTDAAQTFIGHNTFEGVTPTGATGTGNMVFGTSPTLVTPVLGAATGTSLSVTGTMTAGSATAITAGGSLTSSQLFSSTANFGVFVGSGAPSISAAQGSLYLRSDGSSTSTRAYIATNGAGAWTAITTAA